MGQSRPLLRFFVLFSSIPTIQIEKSVDRVLWIRTYRMVGVDVTTEPHTLTSQFVSFPQEEKHRRPVSQTSVAKLNVEPNDEISPPRTGIFRI